MVEGRSSIQREGVYRWFSALTSAQRVDFLCGLLDLCIPIELRFLGSCLEDLARKDYHSLRDAEIKANNPTDLSGLTNITDEVVRSKLLVSLALLGSDNREAAGVLYRTLTHIDTVINNYGLALNDGRTEEQFLLLFTMASNHPAFSFHQKQVLRQQLSQIQDILQVGSKDTAEAQGASSDCPPPQPHQQSQTPLSPCSCSVPEDSVPYLSSAFQPCHTHCTCWHKTSNNRDVPNVGRGGLNLGPPHHDAPPPSPLPPAQPAAHKQDTTTSTKSHQGKTTKVTIERVILRGVTRKSEDTTEFVFETNWSDGFVSSIVRTEQEATELLTQLSQALSDEEVEKFLPQNMDPRCLSTLPPHMLQHHSVQLFFTGTRSLSPTISTANPLPPLPSTQSTVSTATTCSYSPSSNPGFMVQHKAVNRPVYKVASVLPVVSTHSSVMTRPSIPISSLPPSLPQAFPHPQHSLPLPTMPPPHPGTGDPPSHSPAQHSFPQPHLQTPTSQASAPLPYCQSLSFSQAHSQTLSYSHFPSRPPSHQLPPAQSQASAPEQNGILDWLRKLRLHKYYPVFKQLTMEEFLALTEEDLNKYDLTQGAKKKLKTQLELQKSVDREMKMEKRLCSGIARVTPSSYMGLSSHHTSNAAELRVEVEAGTHHPPVSTDSSSSSGYSSSPCSPRTPLCCDASFDRSREFHRRVSGPDTLCTSPEKDRSSFYILNSSCPTGSTRPTAQVLPVQTDPPPPPFTVPQTSFPLQASYAQQNLLSPLSNPARILTTPRKPRPPPPPPDDRSKPLVFGAGFGAGVGVGVRLETLFPGLNIDGSPPGRQQDSVVCRGLVSGTVGLMVETSSALTSTSNSHHHVSHPPVHFHLSSSSSPTASGPYSCPLVSSCSTSKPQTGLMATGSTIPRSNYYPPNSSSSSSAPSLECGTSDHTPSACVCSSCGCRGNCGAYGALPGYATAGYLQQFTPGPSLFTLGPLLHLSPLIASSTSGNGATPFPYPMMVPPVYHHSPQSHDQQQSHFPGMLGNVGQKQMAGNLSCYNCGASGHRAEECKQPSMDSAQQGMFRLKYSAHSDTKDSGD
ncbi:zinc finger CCHC domain-containing protein 14 isoform X1 [Periophthalmus magnuspinnatus]|uniref:zinc finger CCHC domain-containing protein 14 isoform X1 n=1 Tax=Periophthalmus magnuspinnatus TaxID=409849 RepID=UPI00145A20E9|nr:zinc finger CCHC domain-containing protein 14 isoform X1 [Periophthalmus magnuspinnatus]XP_055078486.1 zinc finger CCHC domain-containing protein 14 isoform X1 [Periophthalmus magnuspinnatus]